MRILNSCVIYKFLTVNPGFPSSQPHTFWTTAIRRDIPLSFQKGSNVVSTNFAKTLVANLNMTSHCDVTNCVHPVTMITIHHCSILQFCRGAYNQAIAPRITRPLHATGWTTLDKAILLIIP